MSRYHTINLRRVDAVTLETDHGDYTIQVADMMRWLYQRSKCAREVRARRAKREDGGEAAVIPIQEKKRLA